MRLCVVGNSHSGPWKLAWDEMSSQFPDVSIRFFAGPGKTLKYLEPVDGVLFSRDAELQRYLTLTGGGAIRPDDYDMFCIVGCGVVMLPLVKLYESWRGESHQGSEGTFQLVSDACFEAAARGMMSASHGLAICRNLRTLTTKPIYLVPQPMPSEAIVQRRAIKHAGWRMALEAGDDKALADLFARLLGELSQGDVAVLPQPASTLATPLLTHERFSRDSRHLFQPDEAHPGNEYFHMNAEFGAISLGDFLSAAVGKRSAAA